MSISPARIAAFDVLLRIERERAFSSVLLPLYEDRLSPADRGLCHELVLGSLRNQIKLDRQIDTLAKGRKLDLEVRIALRLALLQIYHLDKIPARAAINDSVDLVKRAKKTSAAGFVNAILRRASVEPPTLTFTDELDRISVETSHPSWLIERWSKQIGSDAAERLARSNNDPPKVAFRVLGETSPELQQLLQSATPSASVEGCYLLERSRPLLRNLATENKIYIQDEASQMVARAVQVSSGARVLDVCAAPGGKTGLLASVNAPSITVAGDIHATRVAFLRANLGRQRISAEIVQYDAQALPFAVGSFDAVLVDAPCTGTGTLRHNPEIRYFLAPGDIAELSSKQLRILKEASKAVSKGGRLVYSTCSLEPEEGEQVIARFLSEQPEFTTSAIRVPARFLTADGYARTWPQRDDMDGFFIAAFRRI